jgi:hypothetical protein
METFLPASDQVSQVIFTGIKEGILIGSPHENRTVHVKVDGTFAIDDRQPVFLPQKDMSHVIQKKRSVVDFRILRGQFYFLDPGSKMYFLFLR